MLLTREMFLYKFPTHVTYQGNVSVQVSHTCYLPGKCFCTSFITAPHMLLTREMCFCTSFPHMLLTREMFLYKFRHHPTHVTYQGNVSVQVAGPPQTRCCSVKRLTHTGTSRPSPLPPSHSTLELLGIWNIITGHTNYSISCNQFI